MGQESLHCRHPRKIQPRTDKVVLTGNLKWEWAIPGKGTLPFCIHQPYQMPLLCRGPMNAITSTALKQARAHIGVLENIRHP